MMSQAQKDFAYKCIEWGEKHYQMGHTLAAIAWMESSLGVDNEHNEASYGSFGIRIRTATGVFAEKLQPEFPGHFDSTLKRNFKFAARCAILIYLDNTRYIKQWHRNRGLTITGRRAWQLAAQVYPGGTNWQNRAEYGRVFRQRVKFLKTVRR